jgi:zinc transport system substrate-binding protein
MRSGLKRSIVASLLLPYLVISGCTQSGSTSATQQNAQPVSSQKQLKVVTTFLPVYLFTEAVAGDAAEVEILIKPGTEVHEYQSTPADVQTIAQADVLVENGLGIEEFLEDTVKSAQNPDLKVINASEGIEPIESFSPVVAVAEGKGAQEADHDHDHDHAEEEKATAEKEADHDHAKEEKAEAGHGHSHEGGNPHVWLDPVLAKQQVENIRDGLVEADPANKEKYQANAAAYIQKLDNLNNQFENTLKPFSDRTFITFHDAFPYLAKRYDLKQVAVVAIPEDQLSPTDVQQTVNTVKQYQVKALFSEPGVDNKLLTSLSNDLNVTLRPLDSLESGKLDPQYYFTAMEANLQTLKTAFQ